MATQKPLVIDNGNTQNIANADTLLVGVAVEPSTGAALRIGDVAGTTITTFPGPVRLDGDVTTVGGTTFTTDATFEGNVTFGNGPADTVAFAATTTVVSDINFATPVAHKITNLANGVNPNDAVNVSQLSALVTGVSAVTASSPLASSGGATPDISLTGTVGVSNGGTGTSTAFTQGSVVFAGASGVYSQDNASLFFDDSTNRLGIGTSTPAERLEVSGSDARINGLTVGRGGSGVSTNTALGVSALANATASSSTAVGASALAALTTGVSNTAVGASALASNVVGSLNVAIGTNALASLNASGSVAIGTSALTASTVGGNVAIGNLAAASLTTGANNTIVGNQALLSATTANSNTAIGSGVLALATGGSNTCIGSGAANSLTTGNGNVGVGVDVLTAATTSINNVAIGNSALGAQVGGGQNVAVGTNALANNTANSNTALGNQAALANTTGTSVVAVGASALATSTTAAGLTAVGANALSLSTGAQNTALGSSAGGTVTTGSNLTLVGFNAQPSAGTATNQITLGNTAVTTLRVGNPNNTAPNPGLTATTITTRPAWNIGHNANSASAPFATFLIAGVVSGGIRQSVFGGTPLLYATTSDYRIKTDVQPIASPLDRLAALKPCQFHFTTNPAGPFIEGFIAHEVQDVVPQAVVGTKDEVDDAGNPVHQGLDQAHLVPLLTAACQALAARAEAAEARLAALEAAIASLKGNS